MSNKSAWSVGERDRFLKEVICKLLDGEYPRMVSFRSSILTQKTTEIQIASEGTIGILIVNPQSHVRHRTV